MRKQTRVVFGAAAGCFLVIVALGVVKYLQIARAIEEHSNFAPPPEAVTALVVSEQEWPFTYAAIGSVAPTQGVTLAAEEAGKVIKINFESGQEVAAGQVLVELDTSVEEANLKGAQAVFDRAKQQLARAEDLRGRNANSLADLEEAQAASRGAEANVLSLKATIAKKKVVSPFSGRTGIRLVNLGQYASPGTPMVPLYSLDPLYVNFSLPQKAVTDLGVGQKVEVSVDAFPSAAFEATVSAVNPQVDASTRNVDVQATLANPEHTLRPGMFARVTVLLARTERVVTVPSSSVNHAPYADTVYVIEQMKSPDGKDYTGVRQQVVKVGRARGEQVAILEGVKPGERVVTSGTFKLRPGAAVQASEALSPGISPNPDLPDA